MDCVDSDGEAPPELRLAWSCERWHCLPDAGGLYEQEYQTLYRMAVFSNIYQAMNRLRNATGEQIHNLSISERNILQFLVDLGLLFHA